MISFLVDLLSQLIVALASAGRTSMNGLLSFAAISWVSPMTFAMFMADLTFLLKNTVSTQIASHLSISVMSSQ